MGSKKNCCISRTKKSPKKSWTKIGKRKQHTHERLTEHKILKLEDELKIAEAKIIWRWNKKKIPLGLTTIIEERHDQRLRNRQFVRDHRWSEDSIASRLASRASKEIKEIEIAKSKKGLIKKYKNKALLLDYNTPCRIRNCFICTHS